MLKNVSSSSSSISSNSNKKSINCNRRLRCRRRRSKEHTRMLNYFIQRKNLLNKIDTLQKHVHNLLLVEYQYQVYTDSRYEKCCDCFILMPCQSVIDNDNLHINDNRIVSSSSFSYKCQQCNCVFCEHCILQTIKPKLFEEDQTHNIIYLCYRCQINKIVENV